MPTIRRTCSWCHASNEVHQDGTPVICECGHRADVCRLDCDCPACRHGRTPPPSRAPWRVKPTDPRKVECSPFEEGTVVASCWTSSFAPPPAEGAANARLIAAAPDLLAGCKLALCYMQYGSVPHASYAAARQADMKTLRDAIARAEGE